MILKSETIKVDGKWSLAIVSINQKQHSMLKGFAIILHLQPSTALSIVSNFRALLIVILAGLILAEN